MANRYKYTVVELREGMIGGKMSGDSLEKVLNEHAAQGWQLKAITSVEVKGRVGRAGSKVSSSPLNSRSAELTSTARARSSSVASCGRIVGCRRVAAWPTGWARVLFGVVPDSETFVTSAPAEFR